MCNCNCSAAFALTTVVVLLMVADTGARPNGEFKSRELKIVVNDTLLCPIKEGMDIKEDRVPMYIKTIVCAGPDKAGSGSADEDALSHQRCARAGVHEPHDAHGKHYGASCVEVVDYVSVYYPATAKVLTEDVKVGCVCMLENYVTGKNPPHLES